MPKHVSLILSSSMKRPISFSETMERIEKRLEIVTFHIEETNGTLKMLLNRDRDYKKDESTKILSNLGNMILPYIKKLRSNCSEDERTAYLELVEKNLLEIVSPFIVKMSSTRMNLTPREIQVAVLVRDGKTTKEIANLLSVCPGAIDLHRSHIRKKLGLANRKENLQSALLSLMI